jgi:thiamine-monophosphate kinase
MLENSLPHKTDLKELGEFGLIDHLTSGIELHQPSTEKGIGDDAAILNYGGEKILVTKDLLVESIHFNLTYTPLKHLGYKSAVVNFSDIVAMNGTPRQLLVGLAVSSRFPLEAIEEFYAGLRLACEKYNVDLIGGDTTSSSSGMFISITVLGSAEKPVCRNTAQVNDLVCVSGDLGAAYMGLLLLEREKEVFNANPNMQPDLEGHDYVLERQLKPEARVDITKLLAENEITPTSMIDISDGLASEILHICKQSNTGCHIYEEKIPIDISTANLAEEFGIQPAIAALNGGEDYELLFTINQKDFEKISKLKDDIRIIGHITEASAGCYLIPENGTAITLQAQGWDGLK